jgi:hypothetical protein
MQSRLHTESFLTRPNLLMRPAYPRDLLTEHTVVPGGYRAAGETRTLLVIDDDRQMLETLVCYFEGKSFRVVAATSIAEARAAYLSGNDWAFILSD